VPRGIEYFTKWIEVEPVVQITAHKVQNFVWKNIVCRFGIPKRLVSDKSAARQTMYEDRYQAGVCISRAPLDEWAGRVRQPSLAQGLEEKVGESRRDFGGRGP